MMNELPSLSFPSPNGRASRMRSSRGHGGQRRGYYTALELSDMDEIPLMGGEVGVASDEEEEEEEKGEVGRGGEGRVWQQIGGRKRWQRRMRSHSTLLGLICGGGWQVVLNK